jgi:hypothetical protein
METENERPLLDYRSRVHFPRPIKESKPSRLLRSASSHLQLPSKKPVIENRCVRDGHLHVRAKLDQSKSADDDLGAYIIVGMMSTTTSLVREQLIYLRTPDGTSVDFFMALRTAEWKIRPWYQRILALKHIGAFGIYQCHPDEDYHAPVEVDRATKLALAELYHAYRSNRRDKDDYWKRWIHHFFNEGDRVPGRGRYALRFVLTWSVRKILLFSFVPIILSLVIGFWYMFTSHDLQSDRVAIVQTAWTIASYIVTTAGGSFEYSFCVLSLC